MPAITFRYADYFSLIFADADAAVSAAAIRLLLYAMLGLMLRHADAAFAPYHRTMSPRHVTTYCHDESAEYMVVMFYDA